MAMIIAPSNLNECRKAKKLSSISMKWILIRSRHSSEVLESIKLEADFGLDWKRKVLFIVKSTFSVERKKLSFQPLYALRLGTLVPCGKKTSRSSLPSCLAPLKSVGG